MRERTGLERELVALAAPSVDERQYELRGDWKSEGDFEKAELSTPDQDEPKPVTVSALRFRGATNDVALIFAGVHGTELRGVEVVQKLVNRLKAAAAKGERPRFTTIVIEKLIADARRKKSDPRYVSDPVSKRLIEPNRNFPRPGESYEYALKRGKKRRDRAELLDCYDQPFQHPKVTNRMLAETRILVQLIERERPVRAASIHAIIVPGKRGAGPGIFVDPRGGFDEHTDESFTPEGKDDDALTKDMLKEALSKIKLPLTDNTGKKALTHPFHGNVAKNGSPKVVEKIESKVEEIIKSSTVHYTSAVHPPGTSFGMWAPVPERSESGKGITARKGITTITVEIPRYNERSASTALREVVDVHVDVLLEKFLGLTP